jgi:hypothetical protein
LNNLSNGRDSNSDRGIPRKSNFLTIFLILYCK